MVLSLLRRRAANTARGIGLGLLGTLVGLIGVGFLSAALWLKLAETESNAVAALVLGLIYILIACVILTLSFRASAQATVTPEVEAGVNAHPMESVVDAFLKGLDAGSRSRRH